MTEYVLTFWEDDFDARPKDELRAELKSVLAAQGGGEILHIDHEEMKVIVKDVAEKAAAALSLFTGVRRIEPIDVETDCLAVQLIDRKEISVADQTERLQDIFKRHGKGCIIMAGPAPDRFIIAGPVDSEIADEILNSWQVASVKPVLR